VNCDALYADDAFLVKLFPKVVQRTPERWQVIVLAAASGLYTVKVAGLSYLGKPNAAVPPDTEQVIRNRLLAALSGSMSFAVGVVGTTSLVIDAAAAGPLAVTATGPAPDTISAELVAGGDANAEIRDIYLKAARCGMPPCSLFCCPEDFTLMHAALAAHMIMYFGPASIGPTGQAAQDFRRMKLGPAELERVASAWATNPADGDLAATGPGQLYLDIRSRYVFPVMCA
jgi:hypothetical protein